jgi:hypothetical protein
MTIAAGMWDEVYRNEELRELGDVGTGEKNQNITYKNLQCQLTNHDA